MKVGKINIDNKSRLLNVLMSVAFQLLEVNRFVGGEIKRLFIQGKGFTILII